MPLSDQELALFALRDAELILADYVQPGPRDSNDRTITRPAGPDRRCRS
jgi:hypothetical protein